MILTTNTINARRYSEHFAIAENAIISIKNQNQQGIFTPHQLQLISYDYSFASLENFLEHIGYLLFDDWDGSKNEKHYLAKITKLKHFNELVTKRDQSNFDYETLEREWVGMIESIQTTIRSFSEIRNPIKHVHSHKDDMSVSENAPLSGGRWLDLSKDHCEAIFEYAKCTINGIHLYLLINKIRLKIYSHPDCNNNQEVKKRQALLRTFLNNQYAQTMYLSETSLCTT